jgi:two-component system sensor histidine kinase HydH
MLTRSLLIRIAGPTLFVSLLFLGSCMTAAVYLHRQQSASLRSLDEDLRSRRAAADLLRALEALPGDRPAESDRRRARLGELLAEARQLADKPEEARLVGRLEEDFGRDPRGVGAGDSDREARSLLEGELVPACRELERFNSAEVGRSEGDLRRTVSRTAWSLAGVGAVGSLAGLLMGCGVARGLGRSVLRAEALAEVGQLAAGMAHELRNPLTAIKMLVQTNREEAEARGLPAEDLNVIEKEILRMEGRLNVFIDFARPPKPERRRVDLKGVVDQTLALVGGRARKQRVSLVFDPPGAPIEVKADGEQVLQLLVNLALNALDVMPRGGTLEIELRPASDHHAELEVRDTGPGIPRRHLSRLYEPFFTSKETGLGLGLSVSQRIARDHGGSLRATNRPQGGACFVLRLPASRGPV